MTRTAGRKTEGVKCPFVPLFVQILLRTVIRITIITRTSMVVLLYHVDLFT